MALLVEGTVEGNVFKLHPSRQLKGANPLSRTLYQDFNTTMEHLGGKWDRRMGGHVFGGPAGDRIAEAIEAGETLDTKQAMGQFYTPANVADELVQLAGPIPDNAAVLEPSAGQGALVKAVLRRHTPKRVDMYELDTKNQESLLAWADHCKVPLMLCGSDFLMAGATSGSAPDTYDLVIMNPPFAKGADVIHVTKAFGLLKRGGVLVAIMSSGVVFREDKRSQTFRALAESVPHTFRMLDAGAFKESGTLVNAVMVRMCHE